MKSWVCTNTEKNIWLDELNLSAKDLGIADMTVTKRTLHGGRQDGIDLIEVNNGDLSFSLLPTRGMGIWRGDYQGQPLGWKSPIRGPVHPAYVNLHDRGGLGWVDGFDEWIVRGGLSSMGSPSADVIQDNKGNRATIQLTLHGKIANIPAHFVEIRSSPETETVSISGRMEESAIFSPGLELTTVVSTAPKSNKLTIRDTVANIKGTTTDLELLYHCNYGAPFLEQGSQLLLPIVEMAPRDLHAANRFIEAQLYQAPTTGFVEDVFFYELAADAEDRTAVALINKSGDKAAVIRFNTTQLPYFTQWKNCAAMADGYVTALEPCTAFPNAKSAERTAGRVIQLEPGEKRTFELEFETYLGRQGVDNIVEEIGVLQNTHAKVMHAEPIEKY